MHDAECLDLWHESGEYLVLLQGYGGGGNRFRLDCQRGNGGKEHPGRGKLDTFHQSKQRLEERGWEIIKTVSGIRTEVKITV